MPADLSEQETVPEESDNENSKDDNDNNNNNNNNNNNEIEEDILNKDDELNDNLNDNYNLYDGFNWDEWSNENSMIKQLLFSDNIDV